MKILDKLTVSIEYKSVFKNLLCWYSTVIDLKTNLFDKLKTKLFEQKVTSSEGRTKSKTGLETLTSMS